MNTATSVATPSLHVPGPASRPRFDQKTGPVTAIIFVGLLAVGLLYTGYSLVSDVSGSGAPTTTCVPYLLLGVALLIALGFEFVNGFHDTANAVATVIYTHSLPPQLRRGLVGLLQLPRRAGVERRGGLRHHLAAAGRADPAGRLAAPASRWCSRC